MMHEEINDLAARMTGLLFQLRPLVQKIEAHEKQMDELLKAPPMSREFLHRSEAALVCGVSVKTIDRWVARGTLPRVRDSKVPLIPVAAIRNIPLVKRNGGVDQECLLKLCDERQRK